MTFSRKAISVTPLHHLGLIAAGLLTAWLAATTMTRPFWHVDEYITAQRTREMADRGDWLTVHHNHRPNFNKPPLYYALNSVVMRLDREAYWPARVLSLLYGTGCLVLAGMIAARMSPACPWAPCLAVTATLASYVFSISLVSAHLETGLTFYLLLALYALLQPSKRTRLVLAFLAVALGGLHKIPAALGLILPFALATIIRSSDPGKRRDGYVLLTAGLLGLLPLAFWVGINTHLYGIMVWENFFLREIVSRVTEAENFGIDRPLSSYLQECYRSPLALAGGLIAALVPLLGRKAWNRTSHELKILSLCFWVAFLVLCLMDYRSPRYLVPLIPFGALILTGHSSSMFPSHSRWPAIAVILGLAVTAWIITATGRLPKWHKFTQTVSFVRQFRAYHDGNTAPFVLRGPKLSPSLVIFECDFERSIGTPRELAVTRPGTPLYLIADRATLPRYTPRLERIEVLHESEHLLILKAVRSSAP